MTLQGRFGNVWKAPPAWTALFLLFLAYLVLRARFISLTIDEVTTVTTHAARSVWDMVTYQKDATPNNHVLHTLLVNFTTWLMGTHHFTARIPALLGGVLYFFATKRIAQQQPAGWLTVFAVLVLLGNPFLLEFFSLARGYGLAAAFMLTAILMLIASMQPSNRAQWPWWAAMSAICAFLSVWANFTLLNFYLPYLLLAAVWQGQHFGKAAWKGWFGLLASASLTALVSYQPIMAMRATDQFRFWGNAGFYQETLRPLVQASVQKWAIFGEHTGLYLSVLTLLFTVSAWAVALVKWKKARFRFDADTWISALFLGTVSYNLLQSYLLKIPYLNPRTALFFYSLLALQLLVVARWVWAWKPVAAKAFIGSTGLLVVFNLWFSANIHRQSEWWFDNGTFPVLEYLVRLYYREHRTQPITLDTSWPLQNAFNFHIKDSTPRLDQFIQLPPWHSGREYPRDTEFYIAESLTGPDENLLKSGYRTVMQVPYSAIYLYQKIP